MGQVFTLEDDHLLAWHPDRQAIRDWFAAHDIDDAWVRVPSVIRVNADAIIVEEWLHTAKGGVLTNPDGTGRWAPVRYECTPQPLPTFHKTPISKT